MREKGKYMREQDKYMREEGEYMREQVNIYIMYLLNCLQILLMCMYNK